MAKFGAGDSRWIVDDRADGTNVHNWHWAEKDCLEWSKKRLADLLEDLTILDGEGNLWIKTNKVEKVEGEAYVNIRKGKVIPGYEISVKLSWMGEAKDDSGNSLATVEGTVDLPYIADENADEDPELKVSVKDDGPVGQRLREAFLGRGKSVILERVKKYVEHMTAGGPAKDELQSKPVAKAAGDQPAPPASEVASKSAEKPVAKPPGPKSAAVKEGFKTIVLREKFHCRPHDIYDILMDENRWKGFTQSNAKISREVGGSFSLFDGAITGVNQDLQQDKLIVQKWRFGSWADGFYSTGVAQLLGRYIILWDFSGISYYPNLVFRASKTIYVNVWSSHVKWYAARFQICRGILIMVLSVPVMKDPKAESVGAFSFKSFVGRSRVVMTFEEPETGVTIVKLTQTDVPEEDRFGNATVVENTERGWRDLIFHKIRAVFGYGI
eukprot:Gb_06397 [translate_table: standard]